MSGIERGLRRFARTSHRLALGLGIGVISGCGQPAEQSAATQSRSAEFKNADEELAYLKSLSNPTPEQWKRREALIAAKPTVHQTMTKQAERFLAESKAEEAKGDIEQGYYRAMEAEESLRMHPDDPLYKEVVGHRKRLGKLFEKQVNEKGQSKPPS